MDEYLNIFEYYKDKYNLLNEKISSNIAYYDYTDTEKYSILPIYFERGFNSMGESVSADEASYIYGFDSVNRLIYICDYYGQSFLIYEKEAVIMCEYSSKQPHELRKILIAYRDEEGNQTETVMVNRFSEVEREKYQYFNNRISRIENPINFEYGTFNDILEIEYDAEGKVIEVKDKETWLENKIVYRKINEAESLELETSIIDRLYSNIIKDVIDKYKNSENVLRCIALESHDEPHLILSNIYVRIKVDNPTEYKYSDKEIKIYDTFLKSDCNIIVQYYISNRNWVEDSKNMINKIVDKLRNFNWNENIDISESFQVPDCKYYDCVTRCNMKSIA